jgi:hypothetical protein
MKSLKDGKLNRSGFGERFHGDGAYGEQIRQLTEIHKKRLNLNKNREPLNCSEFRRPATDQLCLF